MSELSASEDRFRALVNATSDVIYSFSADWSVMNELDGRGFVTSTVGHTKDWRELNVHPDDVDLVNQTIAQAIATKSTFELEHRVRRIDGSTGWTFSRAVPILGENGEIEEWFGTASDISLRKQTTLALKLAKEEAESQKRMYETMTSSTPDLIYVFGLDYRFTYANQALLEMWGKDWDSAVGKSLLENGYEPWHAEVHEREIDQVVTTKKSVRGEVGFPHAVLGRRVYDYILNPVFNSYGDVVAVAGTTRDITDRKLEETEKIRLSNELTSLNEEAASINEELTATNEELIISLDKIEEAEIALRLAIEAANFGTWRIHSETREFITSDRLKELFGFYPSDKIEIADAIGQITPDFREYVTQKLENAITADGHYDVTYSVVGYHDQVVRWLRAVGNLKKDRSGEFSAFTGVVMDITESYLAAKKVERAEESLRMAIDAAELGSFHISVVDRVFVPSPKLKEFFGFLPDDEVSYEVVINQIHKDYRQSIVDLVEASIIKKVRFEAEYPVVGFRDGKIRWVRGIGTVQQQNNSIDSFFTGVLHEITERKVDEMRKNDFIGMVSHELKTPLTSLNGYLQLIERRALKVDDEFIINAADKALRQVNKMGSMINGFLTISRLESGKIALDKTNFDLHQLILEAVEDASNLQSSHEITYESKGSVNMIADRDKIGNVLSNLISNAVKYSSIGSVIKINSEVVDKKARVSIVDQGVGIKIADLEKIFDRYYRVQDNSNISGFGIGLYLSAEIIRRHDGEIWAESKIESGSTFFFELPLK